MSEVGLKNFINGPEGFTPDNEFCLGETTVGGFYVAAGFCAHGIAGAGGIGKVVAEWVVAGEPTMDLWHMDIKRFADAYKSPRFTLERVTENYEAYYDIHYPLEERMSARGESKSPIYDWHKENHAIFGEKAAWERVNYYHNPTEKLDDSLRPQGWVGKNWHPAVVVKGVGKTTYTQALNKKGGIESDYTITQSGESEFLIITGTAFLNHDKGWLDKQVRELNYDQVEIVDITKELACFGIWGPASRVILQSLTDADLSNDGFAFMNSKEITVAGVALRATRITYVGELGWELYIPRDNALKVWLEIITAGKSHGLRVCGYRAIESLRLEKGYRAWAGEINSETNPYEAGLGFAVSTKKDNFIGKAALDKVKDKLSRKLMAIVFDDIKQVAMGNEPIFINNQVVGRVKSAGQGYTINKAIAYAYLPVEHANVGSEIEVEMFGIKSKATIAAEPLFDPKGEKIKS